MAEFDVKQLDITKQNVAVERVLQATKSPRQRYLLQSYLRHRYLESAGRWEEILDPTLTVEHPYYRFSLIAQGRFALDGASRSPPSTATGRQRISASSTSKTSRWQ